MENTTSSRRGFIKTGAIFSVLTLALGKWSKAFSQPLGSMESLNAELRLPVIGKYQLPALPYSYDALEPYIDKQTMETHHAKHHQAYIDNLNKAIDDNSQAQALSLEDLCKNASKFSNAVRNNAGGHYNHTFFWKNMTPEGFDKPKGKIAEAIEKTFGTYEDFKTKFTEAALSRFGSGWAWLVLNNGKLQIGTTPNQDNPLMDVSELKGTPLIALDVWEHAYYLKRLNKRADYIAAWWSTVNWEEAERIYLAAK